MTRWLLLCVALADPAPVSYTVRLAVTVAPSRHVVCTEAEPSEWYVVGDLTPDGDGWRLMESR